MHFLLICVLCAVLCFSTGCAGDTPPIAYLEEFSTLYPLPAGRFYHSEAAPHEEGYLAPALFDMLYARSDGDSDREDVLRYAIFLGSSSSYVSEMGIFECPDKDAAYEVVGMLRGRLRTIRDMKMADTSHAEDAVITLYGATVVYLVLDDNPAASRTISRLLS